MSKSIKAYKYKVCHIESIFEIDEYDEYFIPEDKIIFNFNKKNRFGDCRYFIAFYSETARNQVSDRASPLVEISLPIDLANKIRQFAKTKFEYQKLKDNYKAQREMLSDIKI